MDPEFEQNNTIKIEGILYLGYKTLKDDIQWKFSFTAMVQWSERSLVQGNRINIELYLQINSLGLDPVNIPMSNPSEVISS